MRSPTASLTHKVVNFVEFRGAMNTGIAKESQIIFQAFEEFLEHHLEPISREWDKPVVRFLTLKEEWLRDTEFLSSIHEIILHPAYLQIIGMGPVAVPLIINELQTNPDYWFWALSAITGANPVTPNKLGNIEAMTESWLEWWRACDLRNEPICKAAISELRRF
ncbi:MAG: hypothetical protein HY787_25515 [Deltaproteobacteria bacterium]|nr:hypothetical protein [Deltaproteobacteria bacterium]